MSIIQKLADKFGVRNTNDIFYQNAKESNEKQEKELALKSYAYYSNDLYGINYYLRKYLSTLINPKSLAQMKLIAVNYVPKIVKRLALVYKEPPTVILDNDKATETYNAINPDINHWRKEFNRQGKLFNTILIRPIWNKRKSKFDYSILNRGLVDIEHNDQFDLTSVKYQIETESAGKLFNYTIVWTNTEHYAIDEKDRRVILPSMNTKGVNPYGVIPFVVLRLETSDEFWGNGLADVVNGNEHLNGRLTDMMFKLYMSFGVPFGVNIQKHIGDFYLAPNKPILVDNVNTGDVAPSLNFITPDQKVELDKLVNDWFKTELGISKGLPASSFASEEKALSGYAKTIDNLELIDLNRDDQESLRIFEDELFEMQKIILATETNLSIGNSIRIEFKQIGFPKSDQEIWFNREKELQYNISSPIDWLREKHPDMSNDELQEILDKNGAVKTSVKDKPQPQTMTESILQKINGV